LKTRILLDAFVEQADSGHKVCGEAKGFQYTSLLKNQSFMKKELRTWRINTIKLSVI